MLPVWSAFLLQVMTASLVKLQGLGGWELLRRARHKQGLRKRTGPIFPSVSNDDVDLRGAGQPLDGKVAFSRAVLMVAGGFPFRCKYFLLRHLESRMHHSERVPRVSALRISCLGVFLATGYGSLPLAVEYQAEVPVKFPSIPQKNYSSSWIP